MGHPKEKFECMMMTLQCGPNGPGRPVKKDPQTYCFEFALEFLKVQSGNFRKTALNFDIDGLVAQYHCSRDDRTYTVKITPSKD